MFFKYLSLLLILGYILILIHDIYLKKISKKDIIISILIVTTFIIFQFILTIAVVIGPSMNPTLHTKQLVIANQLNKNYERFDIVICNSQNLNKKLIKRVIATEGESIAIKEGVLYINDIAVQEPFQKVDTQEDFEKVIVPEGHFFVMGDNRPESSDSRYQDVGCIPKEEMIGKVFVH